MGQNASTSSPPPTTIRSPPAVDQEKAALAQRHQTRQVVDRLVKSDDRDGSASGAAAGLSQTKLNSWSDDFDANPTLKLSQLVLTNQSPTAALATRRAKIADQHIFNLELKGVKSSKDAGKDAKGVYPGPVTNQKSSGRCWLFATTNCLRYRVISQLNLGDFQLSQSYLFFYDKLEKSNYYLENMLDLASKPLSSRLVSYLNENPINDGGQFDMAVNLVTKYGVCPQSLYPESYSSSNSGEINKLLTSKLKEFALELRAIVQELTVEKGFNKERAVDKARKRKEEMMRKVYDTLAITMGTPPRPEEELTWEYYDREKKACKLVISPRDLYKKHTGPYLAEDCFSIINDPRNAYDTLYTVDRLGNISGGLNIRYVNAEITALEDAVIKSIKADQPVFFGCDSGKSGLREEGIWDVEAYDLEKAYGYKLGMNKAQRLETGDSSASHAMVLCAVHLDDAGRPVRYKIENSWSDANGDKGYFLATTEWFRQYVYQVVIPKKLAEKKYVDVLEAGSPVVLEAWDPMGALA